MNKISAIMFGACAMLSFSACTNDDEPSVNGGGNTDDKGDYVYLAIKINTPGTQDSRATSDPFGYEYGSTEENKVTTAHFYFYNADGTYANITTQSWEGGTPSTGTPTPPGGPVEFKSKGTIVIRGIKGGNYPKYMVTVLNQDFGADDSATFTAPDKLTGWAELKNWNCKNTKGLYVMTTSSYFDGDTRKADNGACYATELKDTDFLEYAPNVADFDDTKRVNVYVERLAARVNVNINLTPATGEGVADGLYETNMTVGGASNPDAKTPLYVKFDGWTLFATANVSRASKSLEGYKEDTKFESDPTTNIDWKWNDPDNFRSYWGKSALWGANFNDRLNTTLYYPDIKAKFDSKMYCNEYTNEYANIIANGNYADPNKTTTVIVAATVCNAQGEGLPLVEFRGVKYYPSDFVKTVFSLTGLDCYTRTENKEKGPYKLADGTTLTIWDYKQIDENDIELFLPDKAEENGAIVIKVKDDVTLWNPGELVKETLELEGEDAGTVDVEHYKNATSVEKTSINTSLAECVKQGDANAFTDGKMYYPIVIEHLNYKYDGNKKVTEKTVTRDGMVGVVRNHAYTINITKINNLGRGVYNPGTKDENGETIKPQPGQDPTYYLESTINILSWKLVEQDAEI